MSQKQTKRARREILIFCREQQRRIAADEPRLDPRVLGNYPKRLVTKTVGKYMKENQI